MGAAAAFLMQPASRRGLGSPCLEHSYRSEAHALSAATGCHAAGPLPGTSLCSSYAVLRAAVALFACRCLLDAGSSRLICIPRAHIGGPVGLWPWLHIVNLTWMSL